MKYIKNPLIVVSVIATSLLLFGAGCSSFSDESADRSTYKESYRQEPENPYDGGSGHSAGYEWAESTGGDCGGSSASFNEGCEEYYRQQEE